MSPEDVGRARPPSAAGCLREEPVQAAKPGSLTPSPHRPGRGGRPCMPAPRYVSHLRSWEGVLPRTPRDVPCVCFSPTQMTTATRAPLRTPPPSNKRTAATPAQPLSPPRPCPATAPTARPTRPQPRGRSCPGPKVRVPGDPGPPPGPAARGQATCRAPKGQGGRTARPGVSVLGA